ncbi:ArsI/CadI family heavy metal resistance metalloenzyme [Hyphomonas sp.]|uniref:ArsI/CadI family heavy metal resistance metalloenzyme n=1 Tax=Hyphomonas sp. TaxID=87 RepID=UPI003D26F74C
MKRLHVHIAVDDLTRSIDFYSTLFSAEPTVLKGDYAKWMLDDPRVNLAISQRGATAGVEHLGIQVETGDELAEVYERLRDADASVLEEGATNCCYAKSEKRWVQDPSGVAWEVFHTTGDSAVYGGGPEAADGRLTSTPSGRALAPVPQPEPRPAAPGCC